MQKKLGDYVKVLVEQREMLLAEYYEPEALLVSDEGVLLTGLLISLNIVDCNLCIIRLPSFLTCDCTLCTVCSLGLHAYNSDPSSVQSNYS